MVQGLFCTVCTPLRALAGPGLQNACSTRNPSYADGPNGVEVWETESVRGYAPYLWFLARVPVWRSGQTGTERKHVIRKLSELNQASDR